MRIFSRETPCSEVCFSRIEARWQLMRSYIVGGDDSSAVLRRDWRTFYSQRRRHRVGYLPRVAPRSKRRRFASECRWADHFMTSRPLSRCSSCVCACVCAYVRLFQGRNDFEFHLHAKCDHIVVVKQTNARLVERKNIHARCLPCDISSSFVLFNQAFLRVFPTYICQCACVVGSPHAHWWLAGIITVIISFVGAVQESEYKSIIVLKLSLSLFLSLY